MSHRKISKTQLRKRLGRNRSDILDYIISRFLEDGEWPAVETVARHLGCAESTIYATYDRAADLKWFVRGKEDRYAGRWPMNTYNLLPNKELATYVAQVKRYRAERRTQDADRYRSSANAELELSRAQTYEAGRKAGEADLRRKINAAKSKRCFTPSPTFGGNLSIETSLLNLSPLKRQFSEPMAPQKPKSDEERARIAALYADFSRTWPTNT